MRRERLTRRRERGRRACTRSSGFARGGLEPGAPGQFFMLEAPGRPLPRPFSLCLAPPGELGFLVDPIGPGTRAIAALAAGDEIAVTGPLGKGFDLAVDATAARRRRDRRRAVPVPLRAARRPARRSSASGRRTTPRRRRSSRTRRSCSTRRSSPTRFPTTRATCSRAAPSRCSTRSHRLVPGAQLAREAPMACGYGACYGCVVAWNGGYRRLCLDGPVLRGGAHGSPTSPLLRGAATPDGSWAPAGQSPAPPAERCVSDDDAIEPLSSGASE